MTQDCSTKEARYYGPETGRFLTTDPFYGMPGTPATLHPYMYGLNNPLIYVDPSGQCYGIFSFVRDYEPVGCGNLDLANSVVFNPNSTIEERLFPAAYQVAFVGSHAGLAAGSAMLAWAYTPSSIRLPIVKQIARYPQIATGAAGGISGMVGNISGQAINNGVNNKECINRTNVIIAGVVGFGAGALAPGATTMSQAVMLGGRANLLQYFMTQFANGDSISLVDIYLGYGAGAFTGWLGGPYVPPTQYELHNPLISAASLASFYNVQAQLHLEPIYWSNFARNILSGTFTNVALTDDEFFELEGECGSEETPVEEQMSQEPTEQYIIPSQTLQREADVNFCTN